MLFSVWSLSLAFVASALATPFNITFKLKLPHADPDPQYVGYFFVHFYDREPAIFAHLSNGNNPVNYLPLNGDRAILKPTVGTKASRDPYLVSSPDQSKHWVIATDLDIDGIKQNWDIAVRKGSRSLIVWESTDLVSWSTSRLSAPVMDSSAGMVWAPEAIWDTSKSAFMAHWASRVYSTSDPQHTGAASNNEIWYSHTTDFKTFTSAKRYIALANTPVIDLTLLPLGGSSYARFIKNETVLKVWEERSTNGLFGTWNRVGGSSSYLDSRVSEGPLAFADNVVPGRIHTFLDQYGGDSALKGYIPFVSDAPGTWKKSSTANFPALTKHGIVKPVTRVQYNAIKARWGI